MWVCKLPQFMWGSIGQRIEYCGNSGLPIMVSRLYQSNVYIKRKLRVWRAQKCIALVGTKTVLTSAWPETTPFHAGQHRSVKEIGGILGLHIPKVPHLHQSSLYIKRNLLVWRAQMCIALVGVKNVPTSMGP